jgi:hypothetical protein
VYSRIAITVLYFVFECLTDKDLTAFATTDFLTDPGFAGDFTVLAAWERALPAAVFEALLVRLSLRTFEAAVAASFEVVL